jgi:hypothetical protein
VLGGGVIGTTTAYFLAKDGHAVEVIDRQRKAPPLIFLSEPTMGSWSGAPAERIGSDFTEIEVGEPPNGPGAAAWPSDLSLPPKSLRSCRCPFATLGSASLRPSDFAVAKIPT